MRCPNCGTENPEASKFCGNCGQALAEAAAPTDTLAAVTEDTAVQEAAAPTEQHAAYEAALAAINKPSTDVPVTTEPPVGPPVAAPVAPTGPVTHPHPQPLETPPPAQAAMLGAPVATTPPDGPNRKVMIGVIIGSVAGLAILAAIYFLFLKNDDADPVRSDLSTIEEAPETEAAGEVPAGEPPAFDSIAPLIADSAGPYSLTQTSSDPCEPPCIFPTTAHTGSTETMQVTYDAGSPESQIYGEFLLYGTVEDAQLAVAATASDLEANGYEAIGTFDISGVTGTTYQSVDDEVLLWSSSNLMMGLAGNKGYPTELVGYLGS